MLLLGVVGQGRGLGERHQAVLAHEWPVPRVKAKVVLQGRIGRKLCPTLFTGERLLIKMLRQFVVLHAWGSRARDQKYEKSELCLQQEDILSTAGQASRESAV